MSTITSQTNGGAAATSDEFAINRAGTDYKLSHAQITAAGDAALAAETLNRTTQIATLTTTKLAVAGGTMNGFINLHANPTSASHASNKAYVDAGLALLLPLTGGTMLGSLVLAGNPAQALEAAPKQYVDSSSAGRWKNSIDLDCSTNPIYPASDAGFTYRVTGSGKIGGASGKTVQVDDLIFCHTTDAVGGAEGLVGSNYLVLQTNLLAADQTTAGYSRFSTDAELVAGTNDTVSNTPRGLKKITNDYVPNYQRTISASTTVSVPNTTQSMLYLLSGAGTGAVGVSLPLLSTISGSDNFTLTIKDAANNASTNNITITPNVPDLIDGAASLVISADSGKRTVVTDGTNWFTV